MLSGPERDQPLRLTFQLAMRKLGEMDENSGLDRTIKATLDADAAPFYPSGINLKDLSAPSDKQLNAAAAPFLPTISPI